MDCIIQAKNIYKNYGKNNGITKAINGISLGVNKGEFIVIKGESGCGKSTLLNLLAGFDNPDKGEIYIQQQRINELNESKRAIFRRKNIGFIFQQFHLIPELSAVENVMFPLLLEKMKWKKAKNKSIEILNFVGINQNINKLPEEFSGGQRQRIAVARSLVTKPELIFADEPTGNLDSKNREIILNLLQQVNKDFKVTIMMVTHSEDETKLADQIIQLKDGKVI